MRTRVKICGITRPEDGVVAARCGADAIGLVFYPPSPRAVDSVTAMRIVAALPAFVTVTALFVDPDAEDVHQVLEQLPVDLLQFHGDEDAQFCRGFGRRYIKAVRMRADVRLDALARQFHDSAGLLLDTLSRRHRRWHGRTLRLAAHTKGFAIAVGARGWTASGQCRRSGRGGAPVGRGCQQRRRARQGHQGRR